MKLICFIVSSPFPQNWVCRYIWIWVTEKSKRLTTSRLEIPQEMTNSKISTLPKNKGDTGNFSKRNSDALHFFENQLETFARVILRRHGRKSPIGKPVSFQT
ncbi:hypothetical protein PoB_001376900 [Plakobranchus ocellatus]|uniref:Uncharacterized protein n=1 Tax=Plakobranchus ocellatus TaxID=259542 RepID=A0AAV3YZQ7_9GAST|nr:hypothetical protein PoB_001376900 [Plakobranchus ocellatus]